MMRRLLIALMSLLSIAATNQVTIKAVNKLHFGRASQTIELSTNQLAALGEKELAKIHVQDADGKELLCQAVDKDGDTTPDVVIFQADFAANATNTFTIGVGEKWVYTKEQFKAFGRFVRERFDDFAWENDRIAHRMYGKALETWQKEPLTSSTVDVWSKRTNRLVVNDWYMVDNYHTDTGEGADFYSAGATRGCGGNGLWATNKLWVSKNFVNSRVLACGPIRVMFELTYEPFDVNGVSVSEVKRITLDAGQNLDHFQSIYKPGRATSLVTAIGLRHLDILGRNSNASHGTLVTWQPTKSGKSEFGYFGCAVVTDPRLWKDTTEDKQNLLVLATVPENNVASYWAGFGWDKSGQFADYDAWKTYVDEFAQGLLSPIEVSVSTEPASP